MELPPLSRNQEWAALIGLAVIASFFVSSDAQGIAFIASSALPAAVLVGLYKLAVWVTNDPSEDDTTPTTSEDSDSKNPA